MSFNLRGARERANITQADLAAILGISQAQVSRYESDPGSIPTELLLRWVQALGTDIQTLLADTSQSAEPIDPGNPYFIVNEKLNLLEQYIDESRIENSDNSYDISSSSPTPQNLLRQINFYKLKPNLVLVGRFDSGKSHLANALMGEKVLPSQYQPATRVITFVRHIEDRPQWFKDKVGILDEDFWEKDTKGTQLFNLENLNSEIHFKNHCINSGSLEVLQEHGVHNHLTETEIEGHSAVVYVDSPILRACNIIDFPGYSDEDEEKSEDTKKANSATQIADLLLYTSPVNGFMNAEDFSRISYLLKVLKSPETNSPEFPTLGNLFIIGTHANPAISGSNLLDILQTGSIRLYRHIQKTVLTERSKRSNRPIEQEKLQMRFFAFWEETPKRWENLRKELELILGTHFPNHRKATINHEIVTWKTEYPGKISLQIEAYNQTLDDIEKRRRDLQSLKENEPKRKENLDREIKKIRQLIQSLRVKTQSSFEEEYKRKLKVEYIEDVIRSQYNNKKEAKEHAAGYLLEQFQGALEIQINKNSETLKTEIQNYLSTYDEAILKIPSMNVGSVAIPFDPTGAFIGGLAGLGGVGALAVWAASLGNLGAYILVAQFVSVLSALGISISGGVATAVSFVAGIGGPITLGLGLIAGAIFLGWALFGESWERRLAKKIVSHFDEKKVLNKFLDGNNEYWQDTETAFKRGAEAVEQKYQEYIQHLEELCSDPMSSKEKIENILSYLRQLQDFFGKIPWSGFMR